MSSILALGAQHLAAFDPVRRDRLLNLSSKHHKVALLGYRAELQHITPQNCHACAAFSLLLNVYAWGGGNTLFMSEPSPSSSPAATGPEPEVELIAVLRGGNAVMAHAKQWVVEGPLAPLYKPWFGFNKDPDGFTRLPSVQSLLGRSEDGERLQQPVLPHEDDARLEQLGGLWAPRPPQNQGAAGYPSPHTTLPSPLSPASHASPYSSSAHQFPPDLPDTARSVLDHTLHMLRRVFVVVTTNEIIEPQAATLSWPIIIPDAYIQMITNRVPQALVLLAHYTVLLKRNDERWWIKNKAEELLQKIYLELQRLPDGNMWIEWIQWPLGEVGQLRPSWSQSHSAQSYNEPSPGSYAHSQGGPLHSHDNSRYNSQASSQANTSVNFKQENVPMGEMGGIDERMREGMMK